MESTFLLNLFNFKGDTDYELIYTSAELLFIDFLISKLSLAIS